VEVLRRWLGDPIVQQLLAIMYTVGSLIAGLWLQRRLIPRGDRDTPVRAAESVSLLNIAHITHVTVVQGDASPAKPPRRSLAEAFGWDELDDWTKFLLLVIAAVLIVVGYLFLWRPIIIAIALVSISGVATSLSALAYLQGRIVTVRWLTAFLMFSSALFISGLLDLYALRHPAFYDGDFQQLLALADREGGWVVLDRYGPGVIPFIIYQVGGATLFLAMSVYLACMLGFILAQLNIAAAARGQTVWHWIARVTYKLGGYDTRRDFISNCFFVSFLAVLAFALCKGWFYNLLSGIAEPGS
jgi:hypothetical protein